MGSRFWLVFFCGLMSCGPAHFQRQESLCAYRSGYFDEAKDRLTCAIRKDMPHGNYCRSPNATWLLLDRATVRFASNDITGAIEDYRTAVEALDFVNQSSFLEQMAQTLTTDEAGAYAGEDYEMYWPACTLPWLCCSRGIKAMHMGCFDRRRNISSACVINTGDRRSRQVFVFGITISKIFVWTTFGEKRGSKQCLHFIWAEPPASPIVANPRSWIGSDKSHDNRTLS